MKPSTSRERWPSGRSRIVVVEMPLRGCPYGVVKWLFLRGCGQGVPVVGPVAEHGEQEVAASSARQIRAALCFFPSLRLRW